MLALSHEKRSKTIKTSTLRYTIKAHAKINLTLDVQGRRPDGYHELATVMQTIDLADTLCLSASDDGQVRVICSRAELNSSDNLVVKAAEAVRQELDIKQGVLIELHKTIPVCAGLGGGSSDAAAVLLALQRWWNLPLSLDDLTRLATTLGADVPFFLYGGVALCKGRGDLVTPLAADWFTAPPWLVLLKPAQGISTAEVYRQLEPADYTDGEHSQAICRAIAQQTACPLEHIHNSLEPGVLKRYPAVAHARLDFFAAGASFVRLSGSGPTLFAPFDSLAEAASVQYRLTTMGYETYLTSPVSGQQYKSARSA